MFKKRKQHQKKALFINALSSLCFQGMGSYYWAVNYPKYGVSRIKAIFLNSQTHQNLPPDKLAWFLSEGHQHEFATIKEELMRLSESEQEALIQSLDPSAAHKYRIVRRYMNRLTEHGIKAYDLSCCIFNSQMLTRSASLLWSNRKAMPLLRKERDRLCENAASLAQSLFSNWTDYMTSYIAGAQFHQQTSELAEEYTKKQEPRIIKLLTSKHSPLQKADWHTALKVD
ncbi:DUF1266 domain-containing protein [Fictibacillus iocasae]|uniref:DUF1266 domain-containing protein n=1 Tax=Fictibacillus iocasae TaxID=2715437 RepID=A0ABW2NN72_9BACL